MRIFELYALTEHRGELRAIWTDAARCILNVVSIVDGVILQDELRFERWQLIDAAYRIIQRRHKEAVGSVFSDRTTQWRGSSFFGKVLLYSTEYVEAHTDINLHVHKVRYQINPWSWRWTIGIVNFVHPVNLELRAFSVNQ